MPPILIDRLKFAWTVLSGIENQVRSVKTRDLPAVIDEEYLRGVVGGVIAVPQIEHELLSQICRCVKIGTEGRFFKTYCMLVKANRPKRLSLALSDNAGRQSVENLQRVLYWLIRKRRDKYVDIESQSPFAIHSDYLVQGLLYSLVG